MNTNETTYVERSGAMNAEAVAARLTQDAQKYAAFKGQASEIEVHSVKAANITRELGLSFAEYYLPNDAAAAENHFNSHYKPTLKMSFAVFQWIIAAARRLPDKSKSMEDLYPALKQMWFAGGLIEEGERAEPQESHDATPVVTVFAGLGKAKVALDRSFEGVDKWDTQTRQTVLGQIADFESLLIGWNALIEKGERATPVVTVFAGLGKAKVALDRSFEGVEDWDDEMRKGVREQIASFEGWLGEIKAKL